MKFEMRKIDSSLNYVWSMVICPFKLDEFIFIVFNGLFFYLIVNKCSVDVFLIKVTYLVVKLRIYNVVLGMWVISLTNLIK